MKIFRRSGRKAIATELGRKLARAGLSIRIAEENAGAAAELASSGSAGELRIGAPPIVAGRFLTDVLSGFIKENPECWVLKIVLGLFVVKIIGLLQKIT